MNLKLIEKFNKQFNKIKNNIWFKDVIKILPCGRTKKSINNIAFFVWTYNQEKMDKSFKIAFIASILLSAQDDILDNKSINQKEKNNLFSTVYQLILNNRWKSHNNIHKRFVAMVELWKQTIKKIKNNKNNFVIWQIVAKNMHVAITEEAQKSKKNISFKNYMLIATESIGAKFIWTTYFISKKISTKTLLKLEKAFEHGAIVSRLSNDLASYYHKKNKINAITIIAQKNHEPVKYIKNLIRIHLKNLENELGNLQLKKSESWIKPVIWCSTIFLVNFYEHGDFDRLDWKKYSKN